MNFETDCSRSAAVHNTIDIFANRQSRKRPIQSLRVPCLKHVSFQLPINNSAVATERFPSTSKKQKMIVDFDKYNNLKKMLAVERALEITCVLSELFVQRNATDLEKNSQRVGERRMRKVKPVYAGYFFNLAMVCVRCVCQNQPIFELERERSSKKSFLELKPLFTLRGFGTKRRIIF